MRTPKGVANVCAPVHNVDMKNATHTETIEPAAFETSYTREKRYASAGSGRAGEGSPGRAGEEGRREVTSRIRTRAAHVFRGPINRDACPRYVGTAPDGACASCSWPAHSHNDRALRSYPAPSRIRGRR